MKNNMGHFSIGAGPSPAQASSGGQGFRRSWVQGSGVRGSQGVRGWVRISRDHRWSGVLYKGVRAFGFRDQGVRRSEGHGVRT